MKYLNRNKLSRLSALGVVHANSPVSFAGVPNNFNFGGAQQPAPMGGGTPAPITTPSKVIPGQPSAAAPEPNTPVAPVAQGSSSLDKYAAFFDNKPKPASEDAPKPTPTVLDATSADYLKTAGKLDFTSSITPEQKAAMVTGGEAGVAAMLDVINNIGRQVYAQAGATASQVGKKSLELSEGQIAQKINQSLVLAQSSSEVAALNTMLENPMYKPMVSAIQNHFLTVKPDLSAKELAELTVGYFANMAKPSDTPSTTAVDSSLGKFFEGMF